MLTCLGVTCNEACQGGGDRPRDRLRANHREGPGGLQGRAQLTANKLMRDTRLPLEWTAQRQRLGFPTA